MDEPDDDAERAPLDRQHVHGRTTRSADPQLAVATVGSRENPVGGPRLQPGVPIAARYRYTHWTGAMRSEERGVGIWDVNALGNRTGWAALADWEATVVPWLLKGIKRASAGWHATHAIEVERSMSAIDRAVRGPEPRPCDSTLRERAHGPTNKDAAGASSSSELEARTSDVLAPHLIRLASGRPARAPLFARAAKRERATDWAREQVWRLCKLAGIPRVTPQGLRGTHSTLATEAGATSHLVAAQLGHASTEGGAYIDTQRAGAAKRRTALRVLAGGLR
jgi:hypothetical protein